MKKNRIGIIFIVVAIGAGVIWSRTSSNMHIDQDAPDVQVQQSVIEKFAVEEVKPSPAAIIVTESKARLIPTEAVAIKATRGSQDKVDYEKSDAMARELEIARAEWEDIRNKIYSDMQLEPEEEQKLQQARADYRQRFEQFENEMSQTRSDAAEEETKEKNQFMLNAYKNLNASFDSDVQVILGYKRFQYLVQQRDAFNAGDTGRTPSKAQISSAW